MSKNINMIKEELLNANIESLHGLLTFYEDDQRAGVKSLIKQYKSKIRKTEEEKLRLLKMMVYEHEYEDFQHICGIDEAGRGPLAGPVVAGAVILPKDCNILYLNDSKKVSKKKREELYDIIMEEAIAVGIGVIGPGRIDEINILQATYEAMQSAIQKLEVIPDILFNDAVKIPKVNIKQLPIIKGDAKSISIAAASIIAKVTRDRLMIEYDKVLPDYGFKNHKGYGSKEHIEALQKFGASPIHRNSFIRNFV